MCFSSKVMAQIVFLQNGVEHKHPYLANILTAKDLGIDQDLS